MRLVYQLDYEPEFSMSRSVVNEAQPSWLSLGENEDVNVK